MAREYELINLQERTIKVIDSHEKIGENILTELEKELNYIDAEIIRLTDKKTEIQSQVTEINLLLNG